MCNAASTSEILKERLKQDKVEEFTSYVYQRVKQRNPDKEVTHGDSCVIIQAEEGGEALHLYTFWEMLGGKPVDQVSEQIDWAIEHIEKGCCNNIYMLYPKTPEFRSHIELTSQRLERLGKEYTLKLVPYRINKTFAEQINY